MSDEATAVDITIRNGAAKLLKQLQKEYGIDNPAELVGLAILLLDKVKDSEVMVTRQDGSITKLSLPTEPQ